MMDINDSGNVKMEVNMKKVNGIYIFKNEELKQRHPELLRNKVEQYRT